MVVGAALVCISAASPRTLDAQAPNLDWRTIKTTHFFVHFTPPTEGLARRIATDAERARIAMIASIMRLRVAERARTRRG